MSTNYIDQITDTAGTTHDISEGDSTRIFRATCTTAASTTAKVATLDTSNRNFSLTAGVRVAVTFKYGNSATTPTLRVDGGSTGTAKTIASATAVATRTTGNGTTYNTWGPYETVIFTYDGTYWVQSGSSLSIYNAYALANSKTANTGTITEVKTTAGAHSTIDVTSGKAEFNVPTKTSHLTNDSNFVTSSGVTSIATSSPISGGTITTTGTISHATSGVGDGISTAGFYKFKYDTYGHVTGVSAVTASDITGLITIPTDTNTTYALSGALSSHKFTSTLTAGGSGSGTSTSDFTLAAGTGITITDDTSNRKMTIACSVTNTDEKLKTIELGTNPSATYYPILGNNTINAETKYIDTYRFLYSVGTYNEEKYADLRLGSQSTGTGYVRGRLALYGINGNLARLITNEQSAGMFMLPNSTSGGTLALQSEIPSRETPAENGTTLSVVNTGDMYTWNNKSNVQVVRW